MFVKLASWNFDQTSSKILVREIIFSKAVLSVTVAINYLTCTFYNLDCSFPNIILPEHLFFRALLKGVFSFLYSFHWKPLKETFLFTFIYQSLLRKDYKLSRRLNCRAQYKQKKKVLRIIWKVDAKLLILSSSNQSQFQCHFLFTPVSNQFFPSLPIMLNFRTSIHPLIRRMGFTLWDRT